MQSIFYDIAPNVPGDDIDTFAFSTTRTNTNPHKTTRYNKSHKRLHHTQVDGILTKRRETIEERENGYYDGGISYCRGNCYEAQVVRGDSQAYASTEDAARVQDQWIVACGTAGLRRLLSQSEEHSGRQKIKAENAPPLFKRLVATLLFSVGTTANDRASRCYPFTIPDKLRNYQPSIWHGGWLEGYVMSGYVDYTGQRIDHVTVLYSKTTVSRTRTRVIWVCRCDCGQITNIAASTMGKRDVRKCCPHCRKQSLPFHFFDPKSEPRVLTSNALQVYNTYKQTAARRHYKFEITPEQFLELTAKECYYCGEPPSRSLLRMGQIPFIYTGIDRIDNSKGYTIDNCRPCCTQCNMAKNTLTEREFYIWATKMLNNVVAHHAIDEVM